MLFFRSQFQKTVGETLSLRMTSVFKPDQVAVGGVYCLTPQGVQWSPRCAVSSFDYGQYFLVEFLLVGPCDCAAGTRECGLLLDS